jgi:hypothetical protein
VALGARKRDEVVCSSRDARVDFLGSRNGTYGYRLAALAIAAHHEADDRGADCEREGDQDDQSLSSDSWDVELASDSRV